MANSTHHPRNARGANLPDERSRSFVWIIALVAVVAIALIVLIILPASHPQVTVRSYAIEGRDSCWTEYTMTGNQQVVRACCRDNLGSREQISCDPAHLLR